MTLGMMHLDGDGAAQDDAAAFECFEGVGRARRAAQAWLAPPERDGRARARECTPLPMITTSAREQPMPGEAAYALRLMEVLTTVEEDAREAMASMDRFTFFANGRP